MLQSSQGLQLPVYLAQKKSAELALFGLSEPPIIDVFKANVLRIWPTLFIDPVGEMTKPFLAKLAVFIRNKH
jgi:hypothetical protein